MFLSYKVMENLWNNLEKRKNDAIRLNIKVVTVSNDDKSKNRKTQRKADLRRRMVCKSLPVKESFFIGHKESKGYIGHHAVQPYREKDNT